MFTCKVCLEKDKRIATLEEQIVYLRTLLHPPVDNHTIPDTTREASGVLSGQDEVFELPTRNETLSAEEAQIIAERNLLLSGEY